MTPTRLSCAARLAEKRKAAKFLPGERCIARADSDDEWEECIVADCESGEPRMRPAAKGTDGAPRAWPNGMQLLSLAKRRAVSAAVFGPGPWVALGPFDDAEEDAVDEAVLVACAASDARCDLALLELEQARDATEEARRKRAEAVEKRRAEVLETCEALQKQLRSAGPRDAAITRQRGELFGEQLRIGSEAEQARNELARLQQDVAALRPKKKKTGASSAPSGRRGVTADTADKAGTVRPPSPLEPPQPLATTLTSVASEQMLQSAASVATSPPLDIVSPPAAPTRRDVGVQCDIELELGIPGHASNRVSLARRERTIRRELENLKTAAARLIESNCELEAEITCRSCVERNLDDCVITEPRLLWHCSHTFCQACVDDMLVADDVWQCSECGDTSGDGHVANMAAGQIRAKWAFKESGTHDLSVAIAAFAQEMEDIDVEAGGRY